jgi:hypothetical protein
MEIFLPFSYFEKVAHLFSVCGCSIGDNNYTRCRRIQWDQSSAGQFCCYAGQSVPGCNLLHCQYRFLALRVISPRAAIQSLSEQSGHQMADRTDRLSRE